MTATIRDIKNVTGLSLATISKYLNGGNLLPENRIKIEKAIKDLHYEVNEMARGLVTSQSKTIGVVVFDISNVFTCTLLGHLGSRLREAGYAVMTCDSQNDPQLEMDNIRFLMGKKVDGLIIMPTSQSPAFLESPVNAGIPVVLLDRSVGDSRVDCVKINNQEASAEALKLLAGYGHRKIAVIGSETIITGKERLEGCLAALREEQIDLPSRYLKLGDHSIEHGYQSMQELLALPDPPSAVFLGNFEIILGAVMAINESSFNCPDDISVVGFDDLIVSNLSKPRLSVVVQPLRSLAEETVRLLLSRIEYDKNAETNEHTPDEPAHVELVLKARIVEGDSVAPANGAKRFACERPSDRNIG